MQNIMVLWLIFSSGLFLCYLFESEYILSLPLSVTIFSGVVIFGFWKAKLSRSSFLIRISIILYALPFIHIFEYFWIDDSADMKILWGFASNPYNTDLEIIKRMTMAGMVGVIGLITGYLLLKLQRRPSSPLKSNNRSFKKISFMLVAFMSLFFSWISTPAETIMTAAYTQSESFISKAGINFNAGWLISYVFASLLLIDAYCEDDKKLRKLKLRVTIIVVLIIVVWFQFMRGDRECIGLLFALCALYLLKEGGQVLSAKKKLTIIAVVSIVFISAQVLGVIRSGAANHGISKMLDSGIPLIKGTWTAVLLTPLSVVGDFYHHEMELKWGKTYIDYLLSLPPGVVTQIIGIERPVESNHGPAWEMRYGMGGTHAMVVPFMNFKSFGVFFVLFLYGIFIAGMERLVDSTNSVKIKLLYSSIIIILPFWFWYGEMYFIRGVMAFYIIYFFYKILPKRKRYST